MLKHGGYTQNILRQSSVVELKQFFSFHFLNAISLEKILNLLKIITNDFTICESLFRHTPFYDAAGG
jgi:hypothetical protein